MSDFELPKKNKTDENNKQPVDTAEKAKQATEKEKPKYNPAELLVIFDELIFSGVYSEEVVIRDKLKIVLKTRTAEEIDAITTQLDTSSANMLVTVNEKRAILNLHYALNSYHGKNLSTLKIEEKATFINKLPAPVVATLMKELAKFDDKVYAAFKEGDENF